MRRKFITILSLMGMSGNVLATETLFEEKMQTPRIQNLSCQYIRDVKQKIIEYRKLSINPESILVVFDVDGTLTDHSYPEKDPKKVNKRKDAVEFVRFLKKEGIKVVISSAWNPFDETIGRLHALGLGQDLGLKSLEETKNTSIQYTEMAAKVRGMNVWYQKEGRAASVRGSWSNDGYYYRQKAVAPYLVYRPEVLDTEIKYVLFPDDSSGNTGTFLEDVVTQDLYPKAKEIIAFTLTDPADEKPSLVSSLSTSGSWHRQSGDVHFKAIEWSEEDGDKVLHLLNHDIPETRQEVSFSSPGPSRSLTPPLAENLSFED